MQSPGERLLRWQFLKDEAVSADMLWRFAECHLTGLVENIDLASSYKTGIYRLIKHLI